MGIVLRPVTIKGFLALEVILTNPRCLTYTEKTTYCSIQMYLTILFKEKITVRYIAHCVLYNNSCFLYKECCFLQKTRLRYIYSSLFISHRVYDKAECMIQLTVIFPLNVNGIAFFLKCINSIHSYFKISSYVGNLTQRRIQPPLDQCNLLISGGFQAPAGAEPRPPWKEKKIKPPPLDKCAPDLPMCMVL